MLKNILMLWYLGINGSLIDFMVKHFSEEDFTLLFRGEAFELQFKYNVFNEDEIDTFYNSEKMKKVEEFVDDLMFRSKEQNIRIISYYDNEYPANLKTIKKRPLIVYVKGNVGLLNSHKSIACVGTRKPSKFTVESVNEIVKGLVKQDTVIVSGLAIGVDTQSHKVCLDNKGKTIAVLAHGLDTIYPKENQILAESILEKGGSLLSEYPLDTKIKKPNFVARNRIVSGLSEGVIIFEADEKSGTMHTARFAYSQGKKIFCPVYTNANKGALSSGVLKLLNSRSAFAVENSSEILALLSEKRNLSITNKREIDPQDALPVKTLEINVLDKKMNNKLNKHSIDIDLKVYEELTLVALQKGLSIEELILSLVNDLLGKQGGNINE